MTSHNQYRCHFCNKICKKIGKAKGYSKYAFWHLCSNCPNKPSFAVGPASKIKGILFSVPIPKDNRWENDENYQLETNYKTKQTKISIITKKYYHHTSRVGDRWYSEVCNRTRNLLTLDNCVNNITPQNVLDKIKMYLLFS